MSKLEAIFYVVTGDKLGKFYRVIRDTERNDYHDCFIVAGPCTRHVAERLVSDHNTVLSKYQSAMKHSFI
jgi:hypothetical protein